MSRTTKAQRRKPGILRTVLNDSDIGKGQRFVKLMILMIRTRLKLKNY